MWGPTGLLARINPQAQQQTWYLFDALGNVAQRLDATGQVKSTDQYDAWGNLLAGGDASDPYMYKGKYGYYTDHETGLILCTHRYYDPIAGRWINRDPVGFNGGINLYGYCDDNPLDLYDESGYTGNPWQGCPGSRSVYWKPSNGQPDVREYGDDGFGVRDVDWSHDHDWGIPHEHPIGRPTDGSDPTDADRSRVGRPLSSPCEKPVKNGSDFTDNEGFRWARNTWNYTPIWGKGAIIIGACVVVIITLPEDAVAGAVGAVGAGVVAIGNALMPSLQAACH